VNAATDRARPLDGVRVLDFTTMVSGPYCTRLLADVGATVIKLEPPAGDLLRNAVPLGASGSRYFAAFNAGKQSVVVDLKAPDGIALARELAGKCEVVVENFRPGVMDKLGLGYAALGAANPALVYCSISGFGQTGPKKDWPAYAPIAHALSGFDHVFTRAQESDGAPPIAAIQIADVLTGAFAFGALQSALIARFRTGRGDYVDATLLEAAMALITGDLQMPQIETNARITTFKAVRARDGYVMPVILTDKAFEALCELIDPAIASDPRFTARERPKHFPELRSAIERWTSHRTARDCQDVLMAAGVPCARYASLDDVLVDPQLHALGAFASLDDESGPFVVNNAPFRFRGADTRIRGGAPALGEHTRHVLTELLEIDAVRLGELVSRRVIA
jgi:crotonobetainyl-CoA:carnitine CoA-transferase CaiB-like acyl-CoA transferase